MFLAFTGGRSYNSVMRLREFLGWYFRSVLGIGSTVLGIASAAAMALAGIAVLPAAIAGLSVVVAAGAVMLVTGFGQKVAFAERDAAARHDAGRKLAEMSGVRDRLSRMRIADGDVATAVRLLALAAGECIDAARSKSTWDPLAAAALAEAADIVDIFLAEADQASTEKRYALPDGDAFPDAKSRTVAALRERALVLGERRLQIDGGLPARDRMSIREEIR